MQDLSVCINFEGIPLKLYWGISLQTTNVNPVVWVQGKSTSGNHECLYANPSDVLIFLNISGADKSRQDSTFGQHGYPC